MNTLWNSSNCHWYRRNYYFYTCWVGLVIVTLILSGCSHTQTTRQCNQLGTPYKRYDCMRDSIFGAESRAQRAAISSTIFKSAVSFGLGGGATTLKAVGAVVNGGAQILPEISGRDDGGFELYWNDLVSKTNDNRPRMASAALADIRADSYRLARFVQAFTETALSDERRIKEALSSSRGRLVSKNMEDGLADVFQEETERQSERLEIIVSLAQLTAIYEKVFIYLEIDSSPQAQRGLATLATYGKSVRDAFNRCDRALETVDLGIGNEFGEKIGSLSDHLITSENERAIISESIMGGAAAGMAVGTIAALIWGQSTEATLVGAGVGSLGGIIAGRVIGLNRIREIKDLKLENNKMKDFLYSADITNKKIADKNRELAGQISSLHLKKKSGEEQKAIAQQELKQAQKQQEEIKKLMEDRKIIAEALENEQEKQYQKRLEELKKQDEALSDLITQLEDLAKDGRIG